MQHLPAEASPQFDTASLVLSADGSHPNERKLRPALLRGFRGLCPRCGMGKIFNRYLKVNTVCPSCGEELHHHRADDAPPYVTIFIVGHIIGTAMLVVEEKWPDAPIAWHIAIWPTLTIALSLFLLPRVKGALIAYQWALRMHGFDENDPKDATVIE